MITLVMKVRVGFAPIMGSAFLMVSFTPKNRAPWKGLQTMTGEIPIYIYIYISNDDGRDTCVCVCACVCVCGVCNKYSDENGRDTSVDIREDSPGDFNL
jgi:hypothetical protein